VILPEVNEKTYWEKLASFFENIELSEGVVSSVRRALASRALEGSGQEILWTRLFDHQLRLLRFDDAYLALNSIKSEDRRRTCLREFVTALCEEGEFGRLCSLPFASLQLDVETALEFKARNSEVDHVPNYYKLLYSYFVFKGNYRKAGTAMYRYAKRLANEARQFSLQMAGEETRAYLAAIHSLSLVEKKNAWIIGPVYQRVPKRRRQGESMDDDAEDYMGTLSAWLLLGNHLTFSFLLLSFLL